MQKKHEKLLPIIISLLLPGLNILNNSLFQENWDLVAIIPTWLFTSAILLGLWYINDKLWPRNTVPINYIKVGAGNITAIGLAIGIQQILSFTGIIFPGRPPAWSLGLRLLVASALFITIQQMLRSVRENERLRSENYALQSENYRAQLEQLKKQLNPHFLFNSLSTLRTVIRSDKDQSEEFVLKLSDVYRQILQTRESHQITLEEELNFLNNYLYLLNVRFDSALSVTIDTRPESMHDSLPVFALQLLVENCIKHNVISEQQPLIIRIFQEDAKSITVANNYQPQKTEQQSFRMGQENLKKRYNLIGIPDGVEIRQNKEEYSVTIKLF
ncbi:sensor histidine kinase [Rhodohalobacter barkolensis]|uniref:Histidine kinase n=1 Tax=Rhodohalobacter barkolensis TaxID=2053187 RepID=A0A2N0VEL9_9BACT|nr:histidine kinase [Rhodohalobacter barkolensis]PKD42644.1 histidine kinase [Rhodohalobacter barkolensis]